MTDIPEKKRKMLTMSIGIAFGVLIFACLLAGLFGYLDTQDTPDSNASDNISGNTSDASQVENSNKVDLDFLHRLLTPPLA